MQKGDIYELSHWFEGDKSDWVVFISPDTYKDDALFADSEVHLLGNIFTDDLGQIADNLLNTSLDDLRDAVLEANHEEYWDDKDALDRISMLIDFLGITVEETETLTA